MAVAAAALIAPALMAVHNLAFELDGDVLNNQGTSNGTFDWADFFDANGQKAPVLPDPSRPGFTASGFDRDFLTNADGSFNTSDDTTFATGSKDTLAISTGWQCNHDANVNSKIDIMNAYAAAYTDPSTLDQIIYFGLERNSNAGDGNVGFWFLQDNVGCVTATTTQSFTGNHRDGDLLIVSAFTNGGVVSTIDVYRWNGNNPGSLGSTCVAHGVDCRTTAGNDTACATVNNGNISTPWLTASKGTGVTHTLPVSEFFEGGLNLTKANLAGHCFNVFIGDTRSSQSLTATLFDFAKGVIGECNSRTETTPSITAPTQIPASGVLNNVTDTAHVTVDGVASFTGSVTWHLCGPFAAGATTLCDSGGVAAGTKPVTTSPATVVSDPMTITEAGRYCWRAEFSATSPDGIPPSSDSRESECFLITPRPTTLSTQAGAGPVNFGQPVTDTASLSNTANHQGSGGPSGSTDGSINPATPGGPALGTITFTLVKSDCRTLASGTGQNPVTSPVLGDGTYGPVSFVPDAPGTYHWIASYSGDAANTVGSSHNDQCNDSNESVVVRQIPTEIKSKQDWIPNDTATITSTIGNLADGGSVAFSLYANATCVGTAVYSQTVGVAGGAPSREVSTTNTTKVVSDYTDASGSVKPYSWRIVYTPGTSDTAHTGKQSACTEVHSITYTNDPGPGTNLP